MKKLMKILLENFEPIEGWAHTPFTLIVQIIGVMTMLLMLAIGLGAMTVLMFPVLGLLFI